MSGWPSLLMRTGCSLVQFQLWDLLRKTVKEKVVLFSYTYYRNQPNFLPLFWHIRFVTGSFEEAKRKLRIPEFVQRAWLCPINFVDPLPWHGENFYITNGAIEASNNYKVVMEDTRAKLSRLVKSLLIRLDLTSNRNRRKYCAKYRFADSFRHRYRLYLCLLFNDYHLPYFIFRIDVFTKEVAPIC